MAASNARVPVRRLVAPLLAALAVGAGVTGDGPVAEACACGVAIDAEVAAERALVIERSGRETIVLSLDLTRTDLAARPAVVVPVPGLPTVEAVGGGDPLAYLDRATAPAPAATGSGDDATAAQVEVISRGTVGGYDVARLGAGDADALNSWLDDNGYALPAGAEPILADYVADDWRFVAIRLARGSEGRLKPLEISFATERIVYPMRLEQLADVPLSLTLYTLAGGERTVEGLERTWSGDTGELEPPPPEGLTRMFAPGRHLTRLEADAVAPSRFTRDLVIKATTPGPIRRPGARPIGDEGLSTLDFVLIACGSLGALVIAFAVHARRRAL